MKQIVRILDVSKDQLVKMTIDKETMYCKVKYKEKHDTESFLRANQSIKNLQESLVIYKIEFHIIYPLIDNPFLVFPTGGLIKSNSEIFYSFDLYQETNDIFVPLLHPRSKFRIFASSKDEIKNIVDQKIKTEMQINQEACNFKNRTIKDNYTQVLALT